MRLKSILFLFLFATLISPSQAQIGCQSGGNLFVYANYDGGVLNINVDVNIPNIKIGICTYEPVTVNLTGPFLGNVTEVRYAGYVSTTNFHCTNSPSTTTINGAPGGALTSVNFLPGSTLSNPNGNNSIVCAYSCNTTSSQGGCNTADQIRDYFQSTTGGSLTSYYTQYGCWSTSPYNLSSGGNCCSAVNACITTADAGNDTTVCAGAVIVLNGSGSGANPVPSWGPATNLNNTSIYNPTATVNSTISYVLTVNDTGSCMDSDTITITVSTADASFSYPAGPFCETSTAVIPTVTGASGGTFSGPGVSASTGSLDPAVAGPGSHVVSYTVVNGLGCQATEYDTVKVLATDQLPAPAAMEFCPDDAPMAPPAMGYPGMWSGAPLDSITGMVDPSISGVGTFAMSYAYTDSNGCSGTVPMDVIVHPTPPAPAISQVTADSLLASTPADSFQWFFGGAPYGDNQAQQFVNQTGAYQVIAWVNGCPSDTSVIFEYNAVSIENGLNTVFSLFPNPTDGKIRVFSTAGKAELSLFDLSGKALLQSEIRQGEGVMDLTPFPRGVYLLKADLDGVAIFKKVIRQ